MTDAQQVTEQKTETGKTGFGLGHINKPTPLWATWTFRVFLYMASFTTIIVTTEHGIPPVLAIAIAKYLGYAVLAVHGLTKMVGVDITKDEEAAKSAFK